MVAKVDAGTSGQADYKQTSSTPRMVILAGTAQGRGTAEVPVLAWAKRGSP